MRNEDKTKEIIAALGRIEALLKIEQEKYANRPPMDLICKADIEDIAKRFEVPKSIPSKKQIFRASGEMTEKKREIIKALIKDWAICKKVAKEIEGWYFDENGNEFYLSAE